MTISNGRAHFIWEFEQTWTIKRLDSFKKSGFSFTDWRATEHLFLTPKKMQIKMTIINSQTSTVNDCIPTLATHSKDSESSFWNSVNHVSMWEGWVPRHFASKSRAAASCPEHRDRASVPWSFQRCLDVFLGFCWRKETAHAKLVFSRKNYSLEMLRDFLECSYLIFEQNQINTLPFYTRFGNQSIKDRNLVSGKEQHIFCQIASFSYN